MAEKETIQLTFELEKDTFPAIIGWGTQTLDYTSSMIEFYKQKEELSLKDIMELSMWEIFHENVRIFTAVFAIGDADIFAEYMTQNERFYKERMRDKMMEQKRKIFPGGLQ